MGKVNLFHLAVYPLAMHFVHLKTSPVDVLGPLDPLQWPNKAFGHFRPHQYSLTKEPPGSYNGKRKCFSSGCLTTGNAFATS